MTFGFFFLGAFFSREDFFKKLPKMVVISGAPVFKSGKSTFS